MDDEVAVRVGDRVADGPEELQTLSDREASLLAEGRHRHALHVLHDEVRNAFVGDAAVVEVGDVGVVQLREDLALAPEPAQQLGRGEVGRDELDRDAMLELPVGALGEVHGAHPALADDVEEAVRAELPARQRRRRPARVGEGAFERLRGDRRVVGRQQRGHFVVEAGVLAAGCRQKRVALGGGPLQGFVQQRFDSVPLHGRRIRGGSSRAGGKEGEPAFL